MVGRREDRLFVVLFALLTVFQFVVLWLSPLSLSPDEAHYWEWSRHLDYCYYSKGPVVAWLIAASNYLFGDSTAAVRLPAALLFTLSSLVYYLFVRSLYGPRAALISWLAFRAILVFAQSGFLMTTDSPVMFFWLLALIFGYQASVKERPVYWLPFALALTLAVWSKYTALLLLPIVGSFLLLVPKLRKELFRVPFLAAVTTIAASLVPLVYWNMKHGWANFSHNAAHLTGGGNSSFRPRFFFELLAGQLGLVGPLMLLGMVYAVWRGIGELRSRADLSLAFFSWMALPLAGLLAVISLFKPVYANWPMPLYLGALLALTHLLATAPGDHPKLCRYARSAIVLSLLITAVGYGSVFGVTYGLPLRFNPIQKLAGWNELGQRVEEVLKRRKTRYKRRYFVLSEHYGIASEISFYASSHPHVYCLNLGASRMNQYYIWDREEEWGALKGKDALIVMQNDRAWVELLDYFSEVVPLSENRALTTTLAGEPGRTLYFYHGRSFKGKTPPVPQRR